MWGNAGRYCCQHIEGKEEHAMTISAALVHDIARIEHAERLRQAHRARRASEARSEKGTRTAARTERRFPFVRGLLSHTDPA
jgi:hypothetical protein